MTSHYLFIYLFIPFYWAGFVAQREMAQQDSKVPYKMPHLTHPPFKYERQPQHRDHPTLIRIVRGFFNVPQNYQHSRNCETGPPVYGPYPRRLESLTICGCNYKGSTLLLSYFKTLGVGPVGVSNSRTPASQPGAQPSEPPLGRYIIGRVFGSCAESCISCIISTKGKSLKDKERIHYSLILMSYMRTL